MFCTLNRKKSIHRNWTETHWVAGRYYCLVLHETERFVESRDLPLRRWSPDVFKLVRVSHMKILSHQEFESMLWK